MATQRKSTDVEPTETQSGDILSATPFQIMLRAMAMEATAEMASFAGDDLNPILTAETEEEIWDADERGPLNFQHLEDCEIAILDVTVKYSRGASDQIQTPFVVTQPGPDGQPTTKKMYLLITAVRLSDAGEKQHLRLPVVGEVFQANTSARYVVGKIWAFYTRGYINPDTGKTLEAVVKGIDLGDNNTVLKLRPMPRRSVRTVTE